MYKAKYENLSEADIRINIDFRKTMIEFLESDGIFHVTRFEISKIDIEDNSMTFTCWVKEKECAESMIIRLSKNAPIRTKLVEG